MFGPHWHLVAAAVGLLVIAGGAWQHGRDAARDACEADKAAALRRAIVQAEALAAQDREIYAEHLGRERRVRVIYHTLTEEAHRYALAHPDDCGLDADGLRLWQSANAGHAAPAADGRFDHALRPAAAAGHGTPAGPADQPHPDGRDVLPLPGAPSRPGGVGDSRPAWGW
jgi:hypothetical protein